MPLLDTLQDGISRIVPKRSSVPAGGFGGGGQGHVSFDDDMIVSKPAIIFYIGQIFFNFLAMACMASVAAFQAQWKVGPSGLSGFAIFISVAGIVLSTFLLVVPVLHEKYDKFVRLARTLKELRVAFIMAGTGSSVALLVAFIVTISAFTEPGCKNPDNDPNASKGDAFKNGLNGWCSTKKAAGVFFWLAFAFWLASFGLLIMDWRSGKLSQHHDQPFVPPVIVHEEFEGDDEEASAYSSIPPVTQRGSAYDDAHPSSPFNDANRFSGAPSNTSYGGGGIAAGRPSMDAYGAFSDPAPTGFGGAAAPQLPPLTGFSSQPASPIAAPPAVSRTMQYADPYAAVRANIGAVPPPPAGSPPNYDSYEGYR